MNSPQKWIGKHSHEQNTYFPRTTKHIVYHFKPPNFDFFFSIVWCENQPLMLTDQPTSSWMSQVFFLFIVVQIIVKNQSPQPIVYHISHFCLSSWFLSSIFRTQISSENEKLLGKWLENHPKNKLVYFNPHGSSHSFKNSKNCHYGCENNNPQTKRVCFMLASSSSSKVPSSSPAGSSSSW